MRLHKIDDWSERDDARRINFFVRHVVVTLDLIDADRFSNSRLLIKIEHVAVEIRVIEDPA